MFCYNSDLSSPVLKNREGGRGQIGQGTNPNRWSKTKAMNNSTFSVDDFLDSFWQGHAPAPEADCVPDPAAMNRSASEWALEKCLEEFAAPASSGPGYSSAAPSAAVSQSKKFSRPESGEDDVVEIKKSQVTQNHHYQLPHSLDRNPTSAVDSEEYRAFLKSKLDLACAAVAMSRASSVKPEDFPVLAEAQSEPDKNSQSATQALDDHCGLSTAKSEANVGPIGIPASPPMRKQEVQVRQTTSGSSREYSDDDDLEGDTGTNEHVDPADAKRVRRMQSNRESARRSRRRKQAQLNELETQVGQLRDERTSLLSRHTDISKKCDEAGVDNRILKANIETLRAKVKMAEEQVKRVTGLNPMLLARNNMPNMGMQFAGCHTDATNVAATMQQNSNQFFHQPVPDINTTAAHHPRLNNGYLNNSLIPLAANHQTNHGTNNVARMNSMQITPNGQNMADLQHVQNHSSSNVGSAGALPAHDSGLTHALPKDNKKKH